MVHAGAAEENSSVEDAFAFRSAPACPNTTNPKIGLHASSCTKIKKRLVVTYND